MALQHKRKELILNGNPTKLWLALLSGLSGYTQREMDVLAILIDKRIELVKNNIKSPYLEELLFSTSNRKEYCNKLGISDFNLTNLFASIRKKHGIQKTEHGEDIPELLIPDGEILVKLIPHDRGTENSETNS